MLCLRSTPIDSQLPSPTELLYRRKLKSNLPIRIDNQMPNRDQISQRLIERQQSMKYYHDRNAHDLSPLATGKHVRQDAVTFFNVKVQKQIGGSDCGLFTLAFATDLCFGLEPHNQTYKQNEMRKHFIRCLESGKMTPFPKTDRRVQTHLSYNKTAIKIFCLCSLPNDKKEYVECFSCKGWYHPECASIPTWAVNSKVPWKCPKCKPQKYKKKGTEKQLGAEDQQKKMALH